MKRSKEFGWPQTSVEAHCGVVAAKNPNFKLPLMEAVSTSQEVLSSLSQAPVREQQ